MAAQPAPTARRSSPRGTAAAETPSALAGLGLVPGDIDLVINTHLHFDHCGQNAVFKHAAFYVQRAELDRCRRESPALYDWFDFQNASFELLDGDAEIRPGLSVITTPGHTSGHQSVLVAAEDGGPDLLIGDAAYTPRQYRPEPGRLPRPGRRRGRLARLGEPHAGADPGPRPLLPPHERSARLRAVPARLSDHWPASR